ncbi:hypothetical protein LOAG_05441 [Loa loa]|uniref:Uncharacterized protein n=1 Tax=Loa loa TaxID=7209 RepID=A0A1S0U0S3_LOALO|nr:hypothetical protein LOAG_05441 [Loa loa]EFO23043.1 hypothetical protein LOAG_05441 [Loa loa]
MDEPNIRHNQCIIILRYTTFFIFLDAKWLCGRSFTEIQYILRITKAIFFTPFRMVDNLCTFIGGFLLLQKKSSSFDTSMDEGLHKTVKKWWEIIFKIASSLT